MKEKNIVPIVFNVDNNYYTPLVVTIISMLKHKKETTFYDVYIMLEESAFSFKENLKELEEDHKNDIKINYIDMKDLGNDFHILNGLFEKSIYYRCFIHDYIKHYDKIIYSDVDVIILEDLHYIYSIDLKDNYIAACKLPNVNIDAMKGNSYMIDVFFDDIGINIGNHFIASFLIMDLKKIRGGNFTPLIIQLAQKGLKVYDQSVLNKLFHNNVLYINPRYTYFADKIYYENYSKNELMTLLTEEEILEYENNPAIIHYISFKPWKLSYKIYPVYFIEVIKKLSQYYYLIWYDYFKISLKYIPKEEIFRLYKDYYVDANKYFEDYANNMNKNNAIKDENSMNKNDRWYKFGQLTRKQKIKTIGQVLSKKLKIYGLIRPIYTTIKPIIKIFIR